MTTELAKQLAKVLGGEFIVLPYTHGEMDDSHWLFPSGMRLDNIDFLSDYNILLPEVDRWCEKRDYWWTVNSRPDENEYVVVVYGDDADQSWEWRNPDRATAIAKAVIAAGGEE